MLDTAIKLFFVLISAPLWMPILRSLREQFQEVFDQETPAGDPRSWNVVVQDEETPTHNAELVDEPLAALRSRKAGFGQEEPVAPERPAGNSGTIRSLRRAS